MSATRKIDFEKSLSRLNTLIEKMETGQLSLESSLAHFEEGITLIRQCQEKLNTAEQKIQLLTEQNGKLGLKTFAADDE